MVAVMVEIPKAPRHPLEPEGRGHELLETWALFRRGGERDGMPHVCVAGYKEPLDKEHANEPPYIIVIDRMLALLFTSGYEHSVEIVKRFYLSNLAVWELAEKMHRTEGFIRLTLRGVCALAEEKVPE